MWQKSREKGTIQEIEFMSEAVTQSVAEPIRLRFSDLCPVLVVQHSDYCGL